MSGHLIVSTSDGTVLDKRKDHSKYVVKVAVLGSPSDAGKTLIATAGWDHKICIYTPTTTPTVQLGEPIAIIDLPTKPEAIQWISHPDTAQPILLVTRTDSSCLFYYTATTPPRLLGQQNLAPHSNAWVAFTPSALALHPTDRTFLAVGTSSVPHMKLLLVRLLIPPDTSTLSSSPIEPTSAVQTQATQARAALATADREAAAITIHANTMAPQTAYSTPAVAWRPDGSGVWVNGDDGAVRGIEACSGKVVRTLTGGHEAGSKIRCLCAGMVDGTAEGDEEVLVSGGFDRRLVIWRV